MRRAEANTNLKQRQTAIALWSLGMTLACIPLFLVSYELHFNLGVVTFRTLWGTAAMLWCPALIYVGIRTWSGVVTLCGLIGTISSTYLVWVMIYWP